MPQLSLDDLELVAQGQPVPVRASTPPGDAAPSRGDLPWPQLVSRLDALAEQYKVPRALVHAVVKQESNWDPYAVGDGGRAKGWFQLHEGAAKDAGIDPRFRHEPALNMLGGIRYLALKYKQAGGDWDKALTLYNGGGDPNYVANVRRHMGQGQGQAPAQPQSSGLLARVSTALSPASAEAAPARRLSLDDLEQRFGGQGPPPPGPPPGAPAQTAPVPQTPAPTTPQALPTSAQTPTPETATPPGAIQGPPADGLMARFDALPSVQSWSAADRAARRQEFAALTPALQEEFLRSEERPSQGQRPGVDMVIDIEKVSPTRGPEESPMQHRGVPPGVVLPLPPADAPLEEQNPAQKWIDTALDVGYGAAGAIIGGATAGLPGMIAGPVVAQGALDRARMQLGIRPQEKALFEAGPVSVYQNDLLNAGFSLLLGLPDIKNAVLSRSKAGQAIRAADDATRTAHDAWQQEVAAAKKAQQEGQQALYEEGVIKARVKQRDYQMQVAERRKVIEANQQEYDTALTQYRQEVQAQQTERQAAETAQGRAIERLRATPERYRPTMPTELPPRPEPAPARAGQVVDPYYHADGSLKQPLNKTPPLELELQDLLRRPDAQGRWGIKLEGNQELTQELTDLLSRRESGAGAKGSGRQNLINNANGVTPDEWAQRLEQLGYTRSADISTFKEALDDSVTYGTRVFSTSKTPPEFVEAATSPTRRASGGSVSSRLYDELSYHHAAPVDPSLVRDRVAELRDMVEPLTAVTPAAARIKAVVTTLEKLELTDVKTVNKLITDMRLLTTSPNGQLRHTAWEALSILEDAVEQTGKLMPETAAAGTVMGLARKAYRQDQAIKTLNKAIQSGGPVISKDAQGREVLNVKAAVNLVDKLVAKDRYFGGAFSEPQLAALRKDIGGLAGTPAMPKGAGRTITPPTRQADPAMPPVPGNVAVRQLPEPTLPGEPARVTPREKLGARPPFGGAHAGTWGLILGSATAAGVPLTITAPVAAIIGAHATQKQIRWLVANALLDPKRSGIVRAAMDSRGRLDRRLYGVLRESLSPAEKQQYLRETR